MADTPPAMPPVKGGLTPYLTMDGAIKAVEFYKKAFAAEVAMVQPALMARSNHWSVLSTVKVRLNPAGSFQGWPWSG